jgi:hypothetical protein
MGSTATFITGMKEAISSRALCNCELPCCVHTAAATSVPTWECTSMMLLK